MNKYLSFIFIFLIKLYVKTLRYEYHHKNRLLEGKEKTPHKAIVFALWHEHLASLILGHPNERACAMVSKSKDGDIAAAVVKAFGIHAARGSTRKGGTQAKKLIIENIHQGHSPALTMDGPKGPRRQVKAGVIDIAIKGGIPIVPLVALCERAYTFEKAWDHFKLAMPFSKIHIVYGNSWTLPGDFPQEKYPELQSELRKRMHMLESSFREQHPKGKELI